jgi:peroxiredoxin Q/BCP
MKYKVLLLQLMMFTLVFGQTEPTPVSDFTLPSVSSGEKFKLSDARGKFVALHFLLKTECPVCLRHTREHIERAGELPNVVQIFIKPDSAADIRAWASNLETSKAQKTQIYRDENASLAKALKIPDGYQFHGESVHYPALVLIDPQGREAFRYIGKSNSDRYSLDKLKSKVAELAKE